MPCHPRSKVRLELVRSPSSLRPPHEGDQCMSSTDRQRVSGNPTPEEIRRYKAVVERFRAESKTSTANGKPSPDVTNGPTLPGAKPSITSSAGMKPILECSDDIWERIAHLAVTERPADSAPLVTYTTTPGPYGDVVTATPEYIAYMRRKVDGYGSEGACHRPVPGRSPEGVGGEEPVRKKPLAKWMT